MLFGPGLWSVRTIVLLTQASPVVHRAVARIATGTNSADNFWRSGNMLGAIDLATGVVCRRFSGTGAAMALNPLHPDTGRILLGTQIRTGAGSRAWSQRRRGCSRASEPNPGMSPVPTTGRERLPRDLTGLPDPSARLSTGNGFGTFAGSALLASATDANIAGERYAKRHAELSAALGIPFARLAPTVGTDWNDVITNRRRA